MAVPCCGDPAALNSRPVPESVKNTIYILEDEESVRRALGRLLRSEGLTFAMYSCGEDFLEHLPPDAHGCAVLDVRMPGLSGLEVQQEMRARGAQLPVIILSAQDDAVTRERARQLGAVAFFRKPVDDQALLDAIHWATKPHGATPFAE